MFDQSAAPTQIELDSGEKFETKVKLVTVSNAPLWGLNNLIAPDARMDDGMFDLAVYDGMGDLEVAKYFLSTGNAQRVSNPNVRFYRTRRVHIRSRQPLPEASDKDELPAHKQLDFEVVPRAIRVIVGQGSGLSWPVDAAHSVPPLTGVQTSSKSENAAEQARPTNGTGHTLPEANAELPETMLSSEHRSAD
jgi:hypothetical protein